MPSFGVIYLYYTQLSIKKQPLKGRGFTGKLVSEFDFC